MDHRQMNNNYCWYQIRTYRQKNVRRNIRNTKKNRNRGTEEQLKTEYVLNKITDCKNKWTCSVDRIQRNRLPD